MPVFKDRIEKKFQLGLKGNEVADLWRELGVILAPYGMRPVQEITSVGSVYFDNKDCDLLRFSLLGHLMLFRTRAYELFGHSPEPISEYWVEVKTARGMRRMKKRFPLAKTELLKFLEVSDLSFGSNDSDRPNSGNDAYPDLYRDAQETLVTMGLKPMLLVTYKRLAFQGATDRLTIDWDVKYYSAAPNIYEHSSWKYLAQPPDGGTDNIILETKLLGENIEPLWFTELQRRFHIRSREYLKPVDGMGFLFKGPLKYHKEAGYLLPRIDDYLAGSLLG